MKYVVSLLVFTLTCGLANSYSLAIDEFLRIVQSGDIEAVEQALSQDWPLIEEIDEYGQTALVYAIENAREVVPVLLNRGANPNATSAAGWTPLAYAVRRGDADLVRQLLEDGADPNVALDDVDLIDQLLEQHPSAEIESLVAAARTSSLPRHSGMLSWAFEDPLASRECYATQQRANWLAKEVGHQPSFVQRWASGSFGESITPEEALYNLNQINSFSGMYFHGNLEGEKALEGVWQHGQAVYVNNVRKEERIFCINVYPYGL